jgi:hypothetical protein
VSDELSSRKPCAECPFGKKTPPGTTGGAHPAVYVGQAWGPFLLACHLSPGYWDNRRDTGHAQCAGAAIFRANVGRAELMPAPLLRCPPDAESGFATPGELLAHHLDIPLEEAEKILRDTPPEALMRLEFIKSGVEVVYSAKSERASADA